MKTCEDRDTNSQDQLISRLGLKITQSAEPEISCSQQQPSGRQQQQHGVGRITQPLITMLPQAALKEAIYGTDFFMKLLEVKSLACVKLQFSERKIYFSNFFHFHSKNECGPKKTRNK